MFLAVAVAHAVDFRLSRCCFAWRGAGSRLVVLLFPPYYYNVASAKDGEEAIKIIKTNKDNDFIKTILLDLNMPKVDGFAVLEFMRQNDLFDKMPVSIISGDCTKETIDKAFTYNIVDMLGKPFNDKSVKEIVDKTIMYKENRDL